MSSGAGGSAAQSGAAAVVDCAQCGAPASGNFCSACGADLRAGSGVLGAVTGGMRKSFPATYLRILLSPVKATVALAEDPTYRQHISFLLSGLAIFCVIMVPFFMRSADPTGAMAHLSESMQTLMKILSQTGVYVGALITVLLGFAVFRLFGKEKRSFAAYLKLYCLAFGFMLPPYAVYDYVARGLMGSSGISSFTVTSPTPEQMATLPFALSLAASLLIWAYFIAIHRRFWRMALWKAGLLYMVAALTSYQLGYLLMFHAGYWVTFLLIRAGVVTV